MSFSDSGSEVRVVNKHVEEGDNLTDLWSMLFNEPNALLPSSEGPSVERNAPISIPSLRCLDVAHPPACSKCALHLIPMFLYFQNDVKPTE